MLSDIIVIVEPFIWIASINKAKTVIELSQVADQQHFLISKNSEALKGNIKATIGEAKSITVIFP